MKARKLAIDPLKQPRQNRLIGMNKTFALALYTLDDPLQIGRRRRDRFYRFAQIDQSLAKMVHRLFQFGCKTLKQHVTAGITTLLARRLLKHRLGSGLV